MAIQIFLSAYILIGILVVLFFLGVRLRILFFILDMYKETKWKSCKRFTQLLFDNFNSWKVFLFFIFIPQVVCYMFYRRVFYSEYLKSRISEYVGPFFNFIFIVFYGTLIYLVGSHFISLLENLLGI